jgi:hypothetical protein
MFPQAASANPSIFKSRSGQPRSASEVYAKLTGRFEVARAMTFSPGLRGSTPAQATPPDTAGVTQAFAQAHAQANAQAYAQANDGPPRVADTRPLFQTMFTDRARRAVAQTVSNLWAPVKSATPAEPARPLDLFTDMKPDTRKLFGGKA